MTVDKENLALACIHQLKQLPQFGFNFVPEHIETRTLYLPEKPGIEQVCTSLTSNNGFFFDIVSLF